MLDFEVADVNLSGDPRSAGALDVAWIGEEGSFARPGACQVSVEQREEASSRLCRPALQRQVESFLSSLPPLLPRSLALLLPCPPPQTVPARLPLR
jgi:hypothetical protein